MAEGVKKQNVSGGIVVVGIDCSPSMFDQPNAWFLREIESQGDTSRQIQKEAGLIYYPPPWLEGGGTRDEGGGGWWRG